jgi:hypothetical protein
MILSFFLQVVPLFLLISDTTTRSICSRSIPQSLRLGSAYDNESMTIPLFQDAIFSKYLRSNMFRGSITPYTKKSIERYIYHMRTSILYCLPKVGFLTVVYRSHITKEEHLFLTRSTVPSSAGIWRHIRVCPPAISEKGAALTTVCMKTFLTRHLGDERSRGVSAGVAPPCTCRAPRNAVRPTLVAKRRPEDVLGASMLGTMTRFPGEDRVVADVAAVGTAPSKLLPIAAAFVAVPGLC